MNVLKERVERGAAWLDTQVPGWELEIDLATLQLKDSCRCVLGQLCRVGPADFKSGFFAVMAGWDDRLHPVQRDLEWAEDHGFFVQAGPQQTAHYVNLDELWISTIKDRLDAGVAL